MVQRMFFSFLRCRVLEAGYTLATDRLYSALASARIKHILFIL